jgi:hypothetical protein
VGRLENERESYFQGSVQTLRALLARMKGQPTAAERLLEQAIASYEDVSMRDYAATSTYRLGEWRSDRGAVNRASEWLRAEGIQHPERWARMRAPAPTSGGSA